MCIYFKYTILVFFFQIDIQVISLSEKFELFFPPKSNCARTRLENILVIESCHQVRISFQADLDSLWNA